MPKGAKPGNKNAVGNKGGGRPSKYRAEYAQILARMPAGVPYTDAELAKIFDVSAGTIAAWKDAHPEFSQNLKAAKDAADSRVEHRLYERALGYTHPDEHISAFQGKISKTQITKHYPPDPTSAIFWLKNRQPDRWSDRSEFTGAGGTPLVPAAKEVNALELARQIAFAMRKGVETKKKG